MQHTPSRDSEDIPEPLRAAIELARAEPQNEEHWSAVDEAARQYDEPDPVSRAYREVIARDLDPELLLRIGQRAVAFHEEWFEDTGHTVEILKRLAGLNVRGDWAFERLSLLLTMGERWEELLAEYDRKLSVTIEPERRLPLLDEAARIAKDFAGQGDRASDYLKERLLSTPDDRELAEALERRLERQHRHKDLIEVWAARLSTLPEAEALATRVQIADRQLNELNDADAALATAEDILSRDNGEKEGCRILEQIAARQSAPLETRRRALAALRERYSGSRRSDDVIRVLELSLAVAETDAERRELHEACVAWLSNNGRHDDAMAHAASLLALAPESLEVHAQLASLAQITRRQDRYASALVTAARGSRDERRIELLVEAGKVYELEVGDRGAATSLYLSVLGDARASVAPRLLVARRLRDLLAEAGDHDRLLAVLEQLAELEPELSGKREVLAEAAKLADGLGNVERSLDLWQRCLEVSEGDLGALDARIAILERAERWEDLIADLRRRAQATTRPGGRHQDLVRIARIYETRLFRLPSAIEVWREIEEQFGSDAETVDALVDLCTAAGRHGDVITRLTAALETESDVPRRTDHLTRLGDVYREHEKAPGRAIELYRQALELDPVHEGARSGLRALLGAEGHARAAVETLVSSLSAADEWPGVLELVELRVRTSEDPAAAKDILLEAASILEHRAQDPSGALAYLCRAFEIDPSPELEGELERLARISGEWGMAASGYQRAIERSMDAERVRALRYQRGQILEERLDDRAAALVCYQQILESDPSHIDAACALIRVAGKQRAWSDLAWAFVVGSVALGQSDARLRDAVSAAASHTHNAWAHVTQAILEQVDAAPQLAAHTAHDLRRDLGVWYRDHRSDAAAAETLFSLAVASERQPETLHMLADLRRRDPGRPLVETLLLLADATPDDLDVLYEAARVALEVVRDVDLAEPILERARRVAGAQLVRLSEEHPGAALGSTADRVASWAIEQRVKLEEARGAYREARRLLVEGAALPFDTERSIVLSYRAALIAVEQLGEPDYAAELCRGILERVPSHEPAIALLADLYERAERYDQLLLLRQRELDLGRPLERRLVLRLDEARILERLGYPAALQIEALRRNVEESPGHGPSIDRLDAILRAQGEHAALFELLSSQARRVVEGGDTARAAALFARSAELSESALGDVDQAVTAYEESARLAPTPEALDALARLAVSRGEHLAAVRWLEQRLGMTPDGDTAARRSTLSRLASALCAAGDEARARAHLREGLDRDPGAAELRAQLAELYRAAADYELLAPLLTEGVAHTSDRALQVEYLRDAARVRRQQLGQLEESLPLLERAVQLEPRDRPLRLSLADGLRHAERYDEARQMLSGLLDEFGRRRTPERARVHFQLAQIARAQGDLDTALVQLDLAAKVEPDNVQVLQALGEVARAKGHLEDAERAYRTLLLLLGRTRPTGAEAHRGIGESSILFELYRIASELGQTERAKDLLDSALEAGAHDPEEAKRLEQALREAGHNDLLLRALEQRRHRTKEPSAVAEILRARAQVLLQQNQLEAALDCQLEALALVPEPTLLKSAWNLAAQVGKTEVLAEQVSNLAAKVTSDDPALACDLWLGLGLASESRGDLQRAAQFYASAQATGQRPLECLEAVERVGVGGNPEALARALRLFVDNADPDVAPERYTEVLYRLGTLDLYQGRPEDAVEHIDIALTRDGDNQRVIELLRASLAVNPATPAVVDLFERVARDADDKTALLAALREAAKLGSATLEALQEAVELATAQKDATARRELLVAAVELAKQEGRVGEAVWAITALSEIYKESGQAQAAVDLLQESIAHVGLHDAFELRLELAALAAHPLGDLELAASVYERLLEEEPKELRVWRPLFDVYRKMGDREKLEARLSAVERVVDDPALRNSLRIERMRILVDAGRTGEAEEQLKALLDEDPSFDEAAELLEALFEGQGRLSELHGVIERRLARAIERGDKAAITTRTLRLAKIRGESDREAALEVFRSSIAQGGDTRELLEAFLALLDPERHQHDRANALYQLIALESGAAAEARTLELVGLYKSQDDFAGVERALDRGLGRVPASEALHAERVQWYRQHNAWDQLARALCDHAAHLDNPALAREQIEQAALIYERELHDPRRAAETLESAADPNAPDPDLLAKIAQHWVAANEPGRAASHLTRAIELHGRDDRALGALLHLRGTLRARMDPDPSDPDASIRDLTRASELAPEIVRRDLADALASKLRRLDAQEGGGGEERGRTLLQLARVLASSGDTDAALRLIDDYVAAHPDDKAAQFERGNLAAQRGDWETASRAYGGLVPLTAGAEQIAVVLKFAEACEKLDRPLAAKEALENVHAQFPSEDSVRKRLRKMYQAAKAYKGWANMLMAEAEATAEKEQRFSLFVNAGDLYRQSEEGALAEARAAYARAMELEDDAKTLVKLVDVEVQLGHIDEAASRLEEAIRAHGKRRSPDLSLLQHAMARVANAAGDEEAVFAWLEAALFSDRQNGAVASELAALAMARGEFDTAIKALQLVTLLKSPGPMSRAEAYLRQAAIAKHRGDIKKSALLAKRAITTDPDYEEAKVFLSELQVRDSMIPEA